LNFKDRVSSIHEGGRCRVRAPDPRHWLSPGNPPRFLDVWSIDPNANYSFPFAVVIPQPQLRTGEWAQHRDNGTIWLPVATGEGVEVAIFFIRTAEDQSNALAAAGWHMMIVNTFLPDGRQLLVVAGKSLAHLERQAELEGIRNRVHPFLAAVPTPLRNPRAFSLPPTKREPGASLKLLFNMSPNTSINRTFAGKPVNAVRVER
jgi:hypothetical protein